MVKRVPRWAWVVVAVAVVVGAPIAWYLGSPLFINRTVDEPFPEGTPPEGFPMSRNAVIPEGMSRREAEGRMMEAARGDLGAADAMPTGAAAGAALARGTFAGADDFHRGSGTATVYRLDGQTVLRLDPFHVTNGPDLYVLLTTHAAPKTRADVMEGYVEVARLKGNIGGQNYTLPVGLALADYKAIVIYCKPFHVVFAVAPLEPAN
jgi:hypothetical protein